MRVLAINDVSCIGKCSLTVTLPILSACGITCDVLPTAVLSTHTGGFEGYTFRDLTQDIPNILRHWQSLGIKFDFIYSGYLGSIEQIELVKNIKRDFLTEKGVFIVDPVMGDGGNLYAGFNAEYVEKMRELCREADYILPNETEACLLTNLPYPLTKPNIESALQHMKQICPFPILTGIVDEGNISVYVTGKNGGAYSITHENVEGFFCGAGDVFASAFVGCLARGLEIVDTLYLASDFVANVIRRSAKEVEDKRYGLNFEPEIYPFLDKLHFWRK